MSESDISLIRNLLKNLDPSIIQECVISLKIYNKLEEFGRNSIYY